MKNIYLDNAATTPLDKDVFEKMIPYYYNVYGNSASLHSFGREAMRGLDQARDKIAKLINAKPNEIYFTSGGTESDNWAIKGIAYALKVKGNHIITTAIEHHAVLNSCEYLIKQGYEITFLPVDEFGFVSVKDIENAITDKTILISIMMANNEIGTIQPIAEIAKICKDRKIYFHTDAVQAAGTIELDVKELGIDLLSISAHKFYGPKGIGVLYIKNGIYIDKFISGGEQERSRRGGTSNVPNIVGMAYALEKATLNLKHNNERLIKLRDYFISRVENEIPYSKLNGDREKRLANNISFSFNFIEGESILLLLDLNGIAVSSGSACSSHSLKASHVLEAIKAPIEFAQGTIRFSLGKNTTIEELDYTINVLKDAVTKLRTMSPLFLEIKGDEKYV